MALDLFADDRLPPPEFLTLGFRGAADFRLLGQRLGLVPRRVKILLGRLQDLARWQRVKDLIQRSFLGRPAQNAYRTMVGECRRALM